MSGSEKTEKKFNLAKLRIDPQEAAAAGATKILIQKIPVRKPRRQEFVRVHSDPMNSETLPMLALQDDGSFYLVSPELRHAVTDIKPFLVSLAINRQKQLFIWPIKLPDPEGRNNNWSYSALEALEEAKLGWVNIRADLGAQGYEVRGPIMPFAEPTWPDKSFEELLEIAFRNLSIDSEDHFIIKLLQGRE